METAPLYVQKVGVVLSGTMCHVIMSEARRAQCAKGRARMLMKGKSTKAVEMCQDLVKLKL